MTERSKEEMRRRLSSLRCEGGLCIRKPGSRVPGDWEKVLESDGLTPHRDGSFHLCALLPVPLRPGGRGVLVLILIVWESAVP